MNRDYSLIHCRLPFSSFLLFVLLMEGKNARNGLVQEKNHIPDLRWLTLFFY